MSQIAIVGKEEESLGLQIETAHVGETAKPAGEEIVDRGPPPWIRPSRHVAPRLVEEDPSKRGRRDDASVDLDSIAAGIDPPTQLRDDLPIELDPPLQDHPLRRPARCGAATGEELLESRIRHGQCTPLPGALGGASPSTGACTSPAPSSPSKEPPSLRITESSSGRGSSSSEANPKWSRNLGLVP